MITLELITTDEGDFVVMTMMTPSSVKGPLDIEPEAVKTKEAFIAVLVQWGERFDVTPELLASQVMISSSINWADEETDDKDVLQLCDWIACGGD